MARVRSPKPAPESWKAPAYLYGALLAASWLVFYAAPLFSEAASIQWDAADFQYTFQKYFSDRIREGVIPHWTPYIYSGFPFLADPQTGAWYPLNWPFFLLGIGPRSIQWEIALHALLAAFGAYLLGCSWLRDRTAASITALSYSFSGYFAAHSSHVGMFQTAAWLPWLLWILTRSVDGRWLWPVLAALATGMLVLAGHFQTALYCGFGFGCAAVAVIAERREHWLAVARVAAFAAIGGLLISAVMVVPGLELASRSIRSVERFDAKTNSPLTVSGLATLVLPNALGALEGKYTGPEDITQYYFYGGLLLLPLAALGLRHSATRFVALALIVPAAWYAFGPGAGLYRLVAALPGFQNVRAPVHIWFVIALGLALLAGAGTLRWKDRRIGWAIAAMVLVDLFYWNSAQNPLAYARSSFQALYGNGFEQFQTRIGSQVGALERFDAPYPVPSFGPQNHLMDARVRGTYGYNPLALIDYLRYMEAARQDVRLLDVLGARLRLDVARQGVAVQPSVPPLVTVPKTIRAEGSLEPDAAVAAVALTPDPNATASITAYGEGWYRIRYKAASRTLLRVAEAYFPGWDARFPVVRVDRALVGVVVEAGVGEFELRYRTPWFGAALAVSAISFVGLGGWALWLVRWNRRRGLGSL